MVEIVGTAGKPVWGLTTWNGVCRLTSVLEIRFYSCEHALVWHSRVGKERTLARIIQVSLRVLWFTGREFPERENSSPVDPATIRLNWLSSWIGEVNFEPAAAPGCDDV